MRLVVMGNKKGKAKLKEIASISVHDNGDLFVDGIDMTVQDDVLALVNERLAAGGFIVQIGRDEPTDEQPDRYVTYMLQIDPTGEHFDWALESTASLLWTGKAVGGYEINGFASYVEE